VVWRKEFDELQGTLRRDLIRDGITVFAGDEPDAFFVEALRRAQA
jgi:hypothetical protein